VIFPKFFEKQHLFT